MRQEADQYLACEKGRVVELPVELRKFIGYALAGPFMGWVEVNDPMNVIELEAKSLGDLW